MSRIKQADIDYIYNKINEKLARYDLKAKFFSPWVSPGLGLCCGQESGITYDRVYNTNKERYEAMCRFDRLLSLVSDKDFNQSEIGRLFVSVCD